LKFTPGLISEVTGGVLISTDDGVNTFRIIRFVPVINAPATVKVISPFV